MNKPEDQKLFSAFKPVSDKSWWDRVEAEFGNTDALHWKSYEGIFIKPIYSPSELNQIENRNLFQDNFQQESRSWLLIEEVDAKTEKEGNSLALEGLRGGADGIHFYLSEGIDLKRLLDDIWLDNCFIALSCKTDHLSALKEYLELYQRQEKKSEDLRGVFNYDPFADWLNTGVMDTDYVEKLVSIFNTTSSYSNFKALNISTGQFYNSGGNAIQELAIALSLGVEYIEALKNDIPDINTLLKKTIFNFTCGTNYFFEIAKLRAFRHLWTKAIEAYGINLHASEIEIHCKTSEWNKSLLDQENNIIRNAAESMTAILGGCNYLTINPYSYEGKLKETTQRRIARNISPLLKEEAFLDKVVDPAAGSYYIEVLTNQLMEEAWGLFLEIESKGGFIKAVQSGFITSIIHKVKEKKINALDLRQDQMVGTNVFPNTNQSAPVLKKENLDSPLPQQRAAQGIEELRAWVEHSYKKENSLNPNVTVFNIKNENLAKGPALMLKSVLTSIGFTVDFHKNFEEWHLTHEKPSADLIVVFIDSEKIPGKEMPFFDQFINENPVIVTSAQRMPVSIGLSDVYLPLESLALHQNLGRILSNLKVQKR